MQCAVRKVELDSLFIIRLVKDVESNSWDFYYITLQVSCISK